MNPNTVSNRVNYMSCGSPVTSDDVEIVRFVVVQEGDTPRETPDNDMCVISEEIIATISSDQESVEVLEPETEDNISSDPEDSSTLVKSDSEKLWNGETIFDQRGNRKGTLEHYVRNRRSCERKAEQEDKGDSLKDNTPKKEESMSLLDDFSQEEVDEAERYMRRCDQRSVEEEFKFITGKSLRDFEDNWTRLELKILELAGRKLDSDEAKNLTTSAKLDDEEFRMPDLTCNGTECSKECWWRQRI
ncbi:hypothetical protein DAPPUDRAFT_238803 [Daphnia pulex]|uniref:Uncharacterized protein n=1 Tax=Daphnia pulex TaxID=6669 RepID=E9G7F8_DAPPU|nr:hypothetical protein DAPPUDRAFT_238803 [Daphnia pulex]|eukprot:EFX84457.1 hypothetical protein DAPPUDRAFT_238803 [Daphnia pulex]